MSLSVDQRGLPLSTQSAAAVQALNAGIDSFVRWRTDTFAFFDQAIEADAGFALARLAKGWVLQTARSDNYRPVIEGLVAAAADSVDSSDPRERAYCEGLRLAVSGRGIEASTVMEAMLVDHPTDLFAQRLVQFELFWNGRATCMREISERAAPHWHEQLQGFGSFQSVRAFSFEECGQYELAERCGRQAVEIDASDCWGTHAVAHVLIMQGRIEEGVAWLESLSGNWAQANQIRHHLWWHLCLFLLERGEHDRILHLLATEIRNPDSPLVQAVPDATIDLQNFASLLLRLELRGVDVGERWHELAAICAGRVDNQGNAFSNAHDMMVLAATGQFEQAEALMQSMRDFVTDRDGNLAGSYRSAGIAICAAVLAHRRADYARVVELLSPVRHDLTLVGGSHAQRDLFYQLLVDAAHREERADLIPLFMSDITRLGFERTGERTLYKRIAAN